MSISTVNVPVPILGDGVIANVASLTGSKTVILSGFFRGYYDLLGSHDDVHFVGLASFASGGVESIKQTVPGAFKSFQIRSGATQITPVVCEVSGIDGQNYFTTVASLPAGFSGLTSIIDVSALFPPTGPETDICFLCTGGFRGSAIVLGSIDGNDFNPIGSFKVDRLPEGSPETLTFPTLVTHDKVKYVRLRIAGIVTSPLVITMGGCVPPAPVTGANRSLSNLVAVAINTSLLPGTNGAIDLGDSSHTWRNLRLAGTIIGVTSSITGTKNNELTISVPAQGTSDANGVGIVVAADAAGSGGSGNHDGGNISILPGNSAGSGSYGNVLLASVGGKVGIGNPNPLAALHIGGSSFIDSNNPQLLISFNVTNSWGFDNINMISDSTTIDRRIATDCQYGSYDAAPRFQGSQNYTKYVAFQSRPLFYSSGTIQLMYGFTDSPTIQDGTLDRRMCFWVQDVGRIGGGAVNHNYGLYVSPLVIGSIDNYAVYTEPPTVSFFGGNTGFGCKTPIAPVHVGSRTDTSSNPHILVSADVSDIVGSGNDHAFVDSSLITRSGVVAYNCYDAVPLFAGAADFNHFVSFQSRPTFSGSGEIGNVYGLFDAPNLSGAGKIDNRYGAYIHEFLGIVGTVVLNCGIYVDNLTGGTSNYAIYTDGTTQSYFGGSIGIGDPTPPYPLSILSVLPYAQIKRASGTGDAAIFLRLDTGNGANLGLAGAVNQQINGSATNDLCIRSNGYRILFSADSGNHIQVYLTSVGLGVGVDPSYQFEVSGPAPYLRFTRTSGSTDVLMAWRLNTGNGANIALCGSNNSQIAGSQTNDLAFRSNGYNIIFSADTGTSIHLKIASTGAVSLKSLQGVGTRTVVVDSNGVLSAP